MPVFDDARTDKRVAELRKKEEEVLVKMLSDKYGVPYIDLTGVSIETDALKLVPEQEARAAGLAVFRSTGKKLFVAFLSPNKGKVNVILEDLKRKNFLVNTFLASRESMERAWSRYKDLSFASETKAGVLDISTESLEEVMGKVRTTEDLKTTVTALLKENKGHKVSKMLEVILAGALSTKASDVHIEPEESRVRLRFRLDGVLNDIMFFDFATFKLLTSRLKLLSGMKLSIEQNAQDGRFSIVIKDTEIEIRASMMPGAYGESIVMRILNPESIRVPFEDLGIEPRLFKVINHEISRPNGIMLVTGPTGSGKTTSLYAFLRKIHTPDVKIITIEDPVEYHLPGITQTQVEEEKGYTFLSGLRSALRQDPDVIMVGEIRDSETAKTAINAALTGHLVFSTLHTNNAAGTIPRLLDLGVNSKVIAAALSISMAQRLVRTLCEVCKKQASPTPEHKKIMTDVMAQMRAHGKADALEGLDTNLTGYFVPVGCGKCNNTGYSGRVGIHEAVLMDENIEKIVNSNPSEREIRRVSLDQGILTMLEDGVVKVLGGKTSLEEVGRAVDLYEL